jgi:pimeloyl-ACP methyl ester carboxylesterase
MFVREGLFVEEISTQGEVLILVHGLGGTSNTWYPQIQVLKRDLRVIAWDLAGSGRSAVTDGITIESHVEDLKLVIRSAGVTRVHLAGHSMGTIVCQHLAAESPELVATMVLAGALPQPPEGARTALRDRAAKARGEGMRNIADAIVTGGTSADTKANQPSAAAFVRESLMAQSPEGYARNCEALAGCTGADLSRITCPVLLLTGDEDRSAPPDVGRALASGMARAELQILPGCGHWATIERPKQVSYAATLFHARLRQ